MERRETYTTQQPDGTYVTTTTREQTKYKEKGVWSCGRGPTNKNYCMGLHGILRIAQIILCVTIVCLISSVFGPGPFKGVLFGQTILLATASVAMLITFIFLIGYFFTLHVNHLDFFCWYEADLVFNGVCALIFAVMSLVEAYYSTGSWSNNCNDIGSDGIIHNGCRIIFEWAFASFLTFILACLYALSAFFAHRNRHSLNVTSREELY
uniref:MARVEL domain-containing protein n=2 Tax=Caenorhabditis japonica TaxID=281687 RepID=A0A8R1HGU3_CAEJA